MNPLLLKTTSFFLFISCILFSQNKLEYDLNVGDNMVVKQVSSQDIVQDMNNSKHNIINNLEVDFSFVVKSITDSSYVINFKFDRFKLNTKSNIYGELINIDTNDDIKKDDLEAKIFSGLTKSDLKMHMLKTGKIIKIFGTETMISKMITDAGITDEFTKELMIESMKKEFGDESLARSFEQLTYIYPSKKVIVGDSWINYYSGDINAKNNWTLVNWSKNIELSAKSTVSMTSEEDSFIMNVKGTQDTYIIANKKTGFAETISVTSNTRGNSVIKEKSDLKIPTTIRSKTTYKIIKHVQ